MQRILLLLTILFCFKTFANEAPAKNRRISADTGFLELSNSSPPTNRAIGDFMLDAFDGTTFGFDKLGDLIHAHKSAWSRIPYFLAYGALTFTYFNEPLQLGYHEFGHSTRMRALGRKTSFVDTGAGKGYANFFTYALSAIGKEIGDASVVPRAETVFTTNQSEYQVIGAYGSLQNPIYLMGGLNNEMYLMEKMEDKSYYRQGHALEFPNYVMGKLSTMFYIEDSPTQGDTTGIKSQYALKGIHVDDDDLTGNSERSLYLSSTTYSYLYSWYQYFAHAKSEFKHFSLWGVRAPDVAFYMMSKGMSYKVNSGYQFDNRNWLIVNFEKIIEGKDATELTLGYRKKFELLSKQFIAKAIAMIGPSFSSEYEASIQLMGNAWLTLGLAQANVKSLWGERHITSVQGDDSDYNLWSKFSYNY